MKTKLLLLYGYILPFLLSGIICSILFVFKLVDFSNISIIFKNNTGLFFAFLGFIAAMTLPFQKTIINEDNSDVLLVFEKSKFRKIFVIASVFQAVLVLISAITLLIISANKTPSIFKGLTILFLICLIISECLALISNGYIYNKYREKVIIAIKNASKKCR